MTLIARAAQALQQITSPEAAEEFSLDKPQVDCPVVHHFGPGICIREVRIPAGTFAVGHRQKYDHVNIMLKGKVLVIQDGNVQTLEAPLFFVGKPGRKVGFILEDMVWQNVYATGLKDADEVEAFFIEKSENWLEDRETKNQALALMKDADRADYRLLLEECGISHETARAQTENEEDQIRILSAITHLADSPIDGKGLFLTSPVIAGQIILAARIDGKRTQAGRYVNHSCSPNCEMMKRENGDIDLVAITDIDGCKGGSVGTELTINYRQALGLSGIRFKGVLPCQA